MDLTTLGNAGLQGAVRRNLVSFPAQLPVFPKQSRPDLQWRIASLYFLRGWSFARIAVRYRLTHERVGQIARDWRKATIAAGYIQEIPAGPLVGPDIRYGHIKGVPVSPGEPPESTALAL